VEAVEKVMVLEDEYKMNWLVEELNNVVKMKMMDLNLELLMMNQDHMLYMLLLMMMMIKL
jgi:hypothetical protein